MAKNRNTIKMEEISFRQRLLSFKNLPVFFKMVWQSSPQKTLISLILRIFRSAMPVALLYTGKLIIDQVVALNSGAANGNTMRLWELVGLEFGLAVLTDGLNRMINLTDSLLGDLFSNHTSMRIMRHATELDLDQFEDSVFYDKLERARQQTVGRTILLSQVMSQVQDFISMAFLLTGLIAFNPWLILMLLLAIIPSFLGESYFNSRNYALSRSQTPERRELDYIRYLGASDETAKEVKIFNLSGFLVDRFKTLSDKFYNDNRKRHLILGINPGRFGGGVTGIPFTDTKRLVSGCNIPFEGKQSHEPSSVFIYEMIDAYGGPAQFYSDFFINSPSPLGFTKVSPDGKETNYNYYDSPALIKAVKRYMIESIGKLIELGVVTDVCFCFGTGKNFQFLSKLNEEHMFFGELIPLEHPRYIMQYKSKSRHEYVGKYLSAFSKIK
ncbi:MAG: DUF4918 family protein [Pedobacter sp.]|nr:MAG: DUF4918 family protein [Pedobacter sp.]